jgi:hypothetical protein
VQYSDEKPWDNLEIRVYPGADGEFIFYEDEGDGYNYERGAFSEITFRWNERRGTLTISDRRGLFEGMLESRKFRVLLVDGNAPSGDREPAVFSKEVEYSGKEIVLQLAPSIIPSDYEEVVGYIKNPSFEDDGKAFDHKTPSSWTINRTTSWWGVNLATVKGNPAATDGEYIYGVWDGANDITVSISQIIENLPKGEYFITIDMHASNNAQGVRLGKQRLFAGEAVAYFADVVKNPGKSDDEPMTTFGLHFTQTKANAPLTIGVATDGAPRNTWFKIDNFRLYKKR